MPAKLTQSVILHDICNAVAFIYYTKTLSRLAIYYVAYRIPRMPETCLALSSLLHYTPLMSFIFYPLDKLRSLAALPLVYGLWPVRRPSVDNSHVACRKRTSGNPGYG